MLALDATYRHNANARVVGSNILDSPPQNIQIDSGSSWALGLAPAIEYSWSNLGVIFDTYNIAAGRNTAATITPVVAINFVH